MFPFFLLTQRHEEPKSQMQSFLFSVELYTTMEAFFTSEARPPDQPDHKAVGVVLRRVVPLLFSPILRPGNGRNSTLLDTNLEQTQPCGYRYSRSSEYFCHLLDSVTAFKSLFHHPSVKLAASW